MLVGELDDVTYDLEVDGELVRRQLHRKVWQRGGWATVAMLRTRTMPGWQPAVLIPSLVLIGFPDGAEIINLTAALAMAAVFVPYGVGLISSGRATAHAPI